jgi:hypothetical protein
MWALGYGGAGADDAAAQLQRLGRELACCPGDEPACASAFAEARTAAPARNRMLVYPTTLMHRAAEPTPGAALECGPRRGRLQLSLFWTVQTGGGAAAAGAPALPAGAKLAGTRRKRGRAQRAGKRLAEPDKPTDELRAEAVALTESKKET